MTRPTWIPIILVLLVLLAAGCSSGGSAVQPIAPPVTNSQANQAVSTGQTALGFYDITFNKDTMEFDVVPLRTAMFQANLTRLLQPPVQPINLVTLMFHLGESDIPNGLIVVDITVRHPFVGEPRFRGFDLLGIIMGDATWHESVEQKLIWPAHDELRLVNADGYTRWWNPTEFTSYETIFGYTKWAIAPDWLASGIINGYKHFADDLEAEDPITAIDLENRGTFGVNPGINSRRYEIQFPMLDGVPDFHFNYCVTVSYAGPITEDDPLFPVESFGYDANIQEAFMIDVQDVGSTAFYENESTYGGDLNLEIEIFDWGFGETSVITDEIEWVSFRSPTLFVGVFTMGGQVIPGSTQYSKIFQFCVPVTPDGIENQELFIGVRSTEPDSYAPDIPNPPDTVYPASAHLEAYAIYEVHVLPFEPVNTPPEVGEITGPESVFSGEDGLYSLTYATDLEDGTNLTILWDVDGDDDFADDLDGDDTNLDGLMNFPDKGMYTVIARAVDSGGLFADSEPFEVYVEGCPTEIHSYWEYRFLQDTPDEKINRMDFGFLTQGEYAGQLIIPFDNYLIYRIDIDQPSEYWWEGETFITLVKEYEEDIPYSLDVDDYSGRVLIVLMNPADFLDPSLFQVYDTDGSFLAEFSVGPDREVNAIDTDDNGDLWIGTWENWHDDNHNMEVDPGEGEVSRFQHYVYQPDAPYYIEDEDDACDITGQFDDNNQMFDLAISYLLDRIYTLRGNYGAGLDEYGEIYCWDINPDGSLTLNGSIQNLHVFPDTVSGSLASCHGALVDGDIEIDHSNEASEYCRLIVMEHNVGDGCYFGLMDSDLNMIDLYNSYHGRNYSFTIRPAKNSLERTLIASGFSESVIYRALAPFGY